MSGKQYHTIGVVGVRDFKGSIYTNTSYVIRAIEEHIRKEGIDMRRIYVVTGGGRGVEQMVVQWCEAKNIPYRKIPPNIQEYGPRKAFAIRNNHIVAECDELIVFWDGCIDITTEAITTSMHQSKKASVFPVV